MFSVFTITNDGNTDTTYFLHKCNFNKFTPLLHYELRTYKPYGEVKISG